MSKCKLCSVKPEFSLNPCTGRKEYTGDWHNEFEIACGPWTIMYGGVNRDGKIRLTASGEGRADYYPKFCPECGRRLNDG